MSPAMAPSMYAFSPGQTIKFTRQYSTLTYYRSLQPVYDTMEQARETAKTQLKRRLFASCED